MTSFACCPLCGGRPLAPMFASTHDWLHRCPDCRLGLCNPQPSDDELAEIYGAEYYAQFGHSSRSADARDTRDAALARIKKATYAGFLARAERLLRRRERPPTGGGDRPRLLDVGCGLGYSLLGGEARGWEVAGLEPHAMAGAGLPAHLAARITRGDLDDLAGARQHSASAAGLPVSGTGRGQPPEATSFDLVSLVDVIEHVRDPVATIRRAGALLKPGGVLMLATNSLASRGARSPRWVHFHRAHLWYFDPRTLSAAVEKAGLHVHSVRTAWRVYNLQYVASILAGSGNSPMKRALARVSLKITPRPLRLMPWPPLPEGMLLLASKQPAASDQQSIV